MKRAYLVFGPESSGTRMVTEYLIRTAGAFGDWGHYQSLDRPETFGYLAKDTSVVWRRSLPHGGVWADVQWMATVLRGQGFEVILVGTLREKQATIDSQFRRQHIKTTKQGQDNFRRAQAIVYTQAQRVVYYEQFCRKRSYRNALLRDLGIKPPGREPMKIRQPQTA